NDGGILATGTGGAAPLQYSLDQVNYQPSGQFSGLPNGPAMVYVKDANGCPNSQAVTIPLTSNLTVDAGGDKNICEGKSAIVDAKSNATILSWSPATGLDDASKLNPAASPGQSTPYTLTASLGVCRLTSTMNVLVNRAPVADAGKDQNPCYGQSVKLTGS